MAKQRLKTKRTVLADEKSPRTIPVAWPGARTCPHGCRRHGAIGQCSDPLPNIEAHRQCEQYRAPIHADIAKLVEIESGALMLVRRIKLFVASKSVLTAISFVPHELFGEPGDAWKDGAIDSLAVVGGHTLVSWGYTAISNGLPATPDCVRHSYPLDTELPVTLYAKPFKVWLEHDKTRARPAGLILLVRSDRVRMEPDSQYPRLVLRKRFLKECRGGVGEGR